MTDEFRAILTALGSGVNTPAMSPLPGAPPIIAADSPSAFMRSTLPEKKRSRDVATVRDADEPDSDGDNDDDDKSTTAVPSILPSVHGRGKSLPLHAASSHMHGPHCNHGVGANGNYNDDDDGDDEDDEAEDDGDSSNSFEELLKSVPTFPDHPFVISGEEDAILAHGVDEAIATLEGVRAKLAVSKLEKSDSTEIFLVLAIANPNLIVNDVFAKGVIESFTRVFEPHKSGYGSMRASRVLCESIHVRMREPTAFGPHCGSAYNIEPLPTGSKTSIVVACGDCNRVMTKIRVVIHLLAERKRHPESEHVYAAMITQMLANFGEYFENRSHGPMLLFGSEQST